MHVPFIGPVLHPLGASPDSMLQVRFRTHDRHQVVVEYSVSRFPFKLASSQENVGIEQQLYKTSSDPRPATHLLICA